MNGSKKSYLVIALVMLFVMLLFNLYTVDDSVSGGSTLSSSTGKQKNSLDGNQSKVVIAELEESSKKTVSLISIDTPEVTVENIIDGTPEKEAKALNISELYEQEIVDYDWSYQHEGNIRDLLDVFLFEEGVLIEQLECKSTLCKLKVSSNEASNFNATIAKTMGKIDKVEWQKEGTVTLHKLGNIEGERYSEIFISRYKE